MAVHQTNPGLSSVAAEQSLRDAVLNLGGVGLGGHKGSIAAIAISPGGRWLVTGSWDKTPQLWDLRATEPEKTARVLKGHDDAIFAVAISSDGRWLVTGSDDQTARLWPLAIEEIVRQGERAVGRNFTQQEWEELFPGELYRKTIQRFPRPQ
jgi:WD40 repeat protein